MVRPLHVERHRHRLQPQPAPAPRALGRPVGPAPQGPPHHARRSRRHARRVPQEARPVVQRHRPRRSLRRAEQRGHRAEAAAARLPERRSARPAGRRRRAGGAALVHHRAAGDRCRARISLSSIRPKAFPFYCDCAVILRESRRARLAHQFLDYLLRPAVSAEIVEATRTATANGAALDLLPEAVRNTPALYPPPEIFDRGEWPRTLAPAAQRLRDRIWTEIKSA